MDPPQETFTPSEAAAISGLGLRAIQREIDEGPLKTARAGRNGPRRQINKHDLLYLVLVRDFELLFSKRGKDLIYNTVRRCRPLGPGVAIKRASPVLGLLDLQKAWSEMVRQLARLTKARAMVVSDPEIRGGEPVIGGTRIGVYEVAWMLERGATKEDLLSGY